MPKLIAAIVLLAASGCATVVPPSPDPIPAPAPGATCLTACQNAQAMRCEGVGPLCVRACENVIESGVFSYPIECLTAARTCAAWNACQQ